ncbi:MAG: transcription termination/antitermination protein NusG [Bdellovibrio sp.]
MSENNTETKSEVLESEETKLADGKDPSFKWYIVRTLTGQENKVAKSLKERIVNLKKTEFFSDIKVPDETVESFASGKKKSIKKKFFPGYVFVKMVMNDDTWHVVKNTDKITGFVGGTPTKPAPLTDAEAQAMFEQAGDTGLKRTRTVVSFAEGETVKVIEGPFASFIGTVEAVNEKGKVKVNVSIFGRPTPVELDFSQIERVS